MDSGATTYDLGMSSLGGLGISPLSKELGELSIYSKTTCFELVKDDG